MFLNSTLQDLDGTVWGEPTYPSHLVTECHRLRTVPLKDFTVENLRVLIGQKISLDYLVPLALMLLIDEPFAEGDYYAGDLLGNVLSLPQMFWVEHQELRKTMDIVVLKAENLLAADEELREFVVDKVVTDLQRYQRNR
ncbi:hypothetical protein CCAX7_60870 [Capsulimonas corticalis]|uniref:Uncharacterized protein n=1 Tax=Capsulimonas corticalis TaxID=2219043 RepID=A0A402CW62_9BACT|nr:contact-dependent growth inhibition system immunity protein [Capsulimonas corticalis]BDI34036.1 hypothetical protein CCAX7_60870 [Capsulimonas corticalis]